MLPGLTVAQINPAVISEMNLSLEARGIVVLDTGPYAPRIGFRKGDVILRVNDVEPAHPDDIAALFAGDIARFNVTVLRGDRRVSLRFRT